MGRKLEQTLATLNGLVGDYLWRTGNGLAIDMACYRDGRPVRLDAEGIATAYPGATAKVVVLVHGVMCNEGIWQLPDGSDYGSLLARDLGFTPLYVRYNSGRAIADSGAALSRLLETLVRVYPMAIEELVPMGYSMGGLVVRSACHEAGLEGHGWLSRVRRAIYVGTPHLGAPAERFGRAVANVLTAVPDPYTRLIADIGNLRSEGIRDLGDAHLRHEDRVGRPGGFTLRDPRHPVPLLPSMRHHLIAGALWADPRLACFFGDSLVPVTSATDGAVLHAASLPWPEGRVRVMPGIDHLALAHHPDVYAQIRTWCAQPAYNEETV